MARTRISLKLIRSAAVVVVCVAALSTTVEAKTNFANGRDKAALEESKPLETEAKAACCPDSSACQPQEKKSLLKRLGSRITRFLAFGDKVNYGLTDWLLSDKREEAQESQGSP